LLPFFQLVNSNRWRYRILRHVLFWVVHLAAYSILDLDEFDTKWYAGLSLAIRWLPFTMLNTYVTLYFLIGRYLLRSRYATFFALLGFWLLLLVPLAFLSHIYLAYPYCWPPGPRPTIRQALPEFFDIYPVFVCEVVTGFAVFLQMHKFWRAELVQKMQLKKETVEAELKLLKAQLHPHFLFNTLNNLYTLILTGSHRAPGMLQRLTAILDHVLGQGHSSEVPLPQEIAFCRDYIELERERYGDRLRIDTEFNGDPARMRITPMLFQPLIENAFKHGASEQLGKVWVDIRLSVEGTRIVFMVVNSAAPPAGGAVADGIGIANIRRRLQLLYPGRHQFTRERTETQHSVCISIDTAVSPDLHPGPAREKKPILTNSHV